MPLLHLDTETYSEVPITQGTHRYAENAEVIMWQYAIDDGDVIVTDYLTDELHNLLIDPAYEIVIHNSHFDRTVIYHHTQIDIPTNRIFDTMACALAHSLPGALESLCEILQIPVDKSKDKDGKRLINMFCKPQKRRNGDVHRITKEEKPDEWENFCTYGKRDIEAMREVYKRLPRWNYQGFEKSLWELDQKINDRGICIDLELAHAAIRASSRAQAEYAVETNRKTNGFVTSTNRRDKVLEYIAKEHRVNLEDLTASRVALLLEEANLPKEVLEILAIRLDASKTSTSKYKRVVNGVNNDGRLRGLLQFCGASRTGRWSGRLFQPQNLPRPTIDNEELERYIDDLKHNADGL